MIHCVLPPLARLGQRARHRGLTGGLSEDGKHVDEVAAEGLQAGEVPAVVRHADDDRLLAAALPQLDEEGREVRDEGRGVAAGRPGAPGQKRRDAVALEGPVPRPRPVQRQVQAPGHVGRELPQERLGADVALRDAAPAPEGEVHVLDGELGQAGRRPLQGRPPRGEQRQQLPVEDALREDVEVHVVDPERQQHQAARGHQDLGAQGCLLREEEGHAAHLPHAAERGGLVAHPHNVHRRRCRQQPQPLRRVHRQPRKHLVPRYDGLDARFNPLRVHSASDPHRGRHVVSDASWIHGLQAQHLFLAKRKRIQRSLVGIDAGVHYGRQWLSGSPRVWTGRSALLGQEGYGPHRRSAEELCGGEVAVTLRNGF
mmetsp:Transcript_77139/g.226259  ORF Transcript_77139/g.226259 Transcript_77139/m.226259 type:complete len:370 (+) Transcript_77139:1034-2143(+)